ncbi:very long chain fatty acid elongase 4-like [Ptychodera flava]|uniref:very long chain fatty acid elongase 4-like n=1 Tax=Ptychodera flava TaxID=63121 RepID=UPI00396A39D1
MEIIKDKMYEFSEWYDMILSHSDKRVDDWFLMSSPVPTLAIIMLYLLIVLVGPKIMENREPFQLKVPMIIYNFFIMALSIHTWTQCVYHMYKANYSWSCTPVKYTNDYHELSIAAALWWYYFSKCIEMLDTVFFILRKKNNQLSFLHVYHHSTMFLLWWIGVKWVPGGQSTIGASINCFVHIIMYFYYGLSACGPQFQKYLWWKKYLTILQLIQFFIGIAHAVQSLYFGCDFPLWMHYALIGYATSFIVLFTNFYFHAYIRKTRQRRREKAQRLAQNGASKGIAQKEENGAVVANGHTKVESKKDQ